MNKSKEKENTLLELLIKSAVGAALGTVLTLLLVFGFAAGIRGGQLPSSLSDAFIIVSVIAGTILGGAFSAGKQGRGVVVSGLTAAAMYIIPLLIITLLFGNSQGEGSLTLKIIIAAVAGGCFGGVLRLHRKNTKSRFRK
ncbi:MAG: TIGR04086 family membrane protein [Oscillospiraceae bacterium]